uniref:Transposase domain-containing protein n=1 Tax=Iconisemion striatum TaxID=60296 RepID=A0A1A7YTN3_9TELE
MFLADVYDGQVWKEHQYINGEPFLAEPNNFALMLNVDWFQPFKNAPYSVGAIYLVILNLPREERFKEENMILVGLIPGPKEPSLNINVFLDLLVDELQELWHGVILEDNSFIGHQVYRAALLCLASDIPATRKCAGFVGHGAYRGCHKCLKTFSKKEFGAKTDYSGFERSSWEPRTFANHIHFAGLSRRSKTKAEQKKLEHEYRARWSELFRLSYYDAIRFVVIDPMHNLLLGTARHVFRLWTENRILSEHSLVEIQTRMGKMKVPCEVGRIPSRISSCFTGFTADQWKNWTTIYSLFCLKGLISNRHYSMWSDFVQACIILCSRVISIHKLEVADRYLQTFLSKFVNLFGTLQCTPNMHLHLHLKECMLDFGPVYSFWCFSFERFNGLLGKYNNNNRTVEVQIMRQKLALPWASGFGEQFESILRPHMVGTLQHDETTDMTYLRHMVLVSAEKPFLDNSLVTALPPFTQIILDECDTSAMLEMYSHMYPDNGITGIDSFAMTCKRVTCVNVTYSIDDSRAEKSAYVYARWCSNINSFEEASVRIDPLAEERPGII